MFTYIRNFLLWIRREWSRTDTKLTIVSKAIIAFVASVVLSLFTDWLIPYNFIFNAFRGVIAVVMGASVFTVLYVLALVNSEAKSKNEVYVPFRKRFSYTQRINISIVLAVVTVIFALMVSEGLMYTIASGVIVLIVISLFTFVRPSRDEYLQDKYGIPDGRDSAEVRKRKIKEMLREE